MGMRRFISWQAAMRDLRNEHPAARRQNALREAAPDLLEALKAVEEWWLSEGVKHFDGAPYAMFAARAAIAKAEGNHAE